MDPRRIATLAVLVVLGLCAFLPPHLNGYLLRFFTLLFTMAILAQGWNLIGGFAGYASFGNVVHFGVGAFACGYAMTALHWPFWPALVLAVVVASLYAFVLGAPILRLRGHYFAIATLAVGIGTRELVAQIHALGGGSGLTLPVNPNFGFFYYTMLSLLALTIALTHFIANSRLGYALVAIRENEDAAAVLGIDTARAKTLAWVLSATVTSAAGATFGFWSTFIDPPTVFDLNFNVQMIIMAMLGGAGSVAGPTIGAFLLQSLSEVIWRQSASPWHTVVLGAVIVLVVILLPRGVMPLVGAGAGRWNLRTLREQLKASSV